MRPLQRAQLRQLAQRYGYTLAEPAREERVVTIADGKHGSFVLD